MIRFIAIAALLLTGVAAAQQRSQPRSQAPAQQELGRFEDWIAYTAEENGQKVCYAGVKAKASAPDLSGRGDVILYVTHRPGSRDQVMMLSGYAYPSGAEATLAVDGGTAQPLYTGGRAAFARAGRSAPAVARRPPSSPPARRSGQQQR